MHKFNQKLTELKGRQFHFIGIGGIGMSGLAEIMLDKGYRVSGSDQASSAITKRLIKLGADITEGHPGDRVMEADVVIYSSAIQEDNPELILARERGIPIWH